MIHTILTGMAIYWCMGMAYALIKLARHVPFQGGENLIVVDGEIHRIGLYDFESVPQGIGIVLCTSFCWPLLLGEKP